VPAALIGGCTFASKQFGALPDSFRAIFCRLTLTLAPIGFSMWLAHFGFHLFTALFSPIPVIQRMIVDLRLGSLTPWWSLRMPAIPQLLDFQCLALDLGFLVSLYFAWRVSQDLARTSRAAPVFLPWAILLGLLYLSGIWIFFQPMEMRGMLN